MVFHGVQSEVLCKKKIMKLEKEIYRKLHRDDKCQIQGYVDALIRPKSC